MAASSCLLDKNGLEHTSQQPGRRSCIATADEHRWSMPGRLLQGGGVGLFGIWERPDWLVRAMAEGCCRPTAVSADFYADTRIPGTAPSHHADCTG